MYKVNRHTITTHAAYKHKEHHTCILIHSLVRALIKEAVGCENVWICFSVFWLMDWWRWLYVPTWPLWSTYIVSHIYMAEQSMHNTPLCSWAINDSCPIALSWRHLMTELAASRVGHTTKAWLGFATSASTTLIFSTRVVLSSFNIPLKSSLVRCLGMLVTFTVWPGGGEDESGELRHLPHKKRQMTLPVCVCASQYAHAFYHMMTSYIKGSRRAGNKVTTWQ